MTINREIIGWLLVSAGGICAIAAAAVKGGTFEALTAASAVFTSASATWGYLNKTPPKV